MIAYFDTSAFVPLLLAEPASDACRDLWNAADAVVSTWILYAEAGAAIARAERAGRLDGEESGGALRRLDRRWREVRKIAVTDTLVHAAVGRAMRFGLRGYDAVHCASAEQLADDDLVAASGDRTLLAAWRDLGMRTFDLNRLG